MEFNDSILPVYVFSARCNIYISRLRYDVSVRLSVRLSVTEVHCSHSACREEGMGSSCAMLATARPSCYLCYLATSL